MINFKDHFSQQSDVYLKYRPTYPKELYTYLASLTDKHDLAWDCGTGNGQAATGLSEFYKQVIGTDPSERQIKNAIPDDKVKYLVEKAEHTSIESSTVDLLTIANALHWFDFDAFYTEARRVLKKNGIIAAWSYPTPTASKKIDKVLQYFHDHTVDEFWQHENRLVDAEYTTIPFPFEPVDCPEFYIEKEMNMADMIGYLNTWSATQRYINTYHVNPAESIRDDLKTAWGDESDLKTIRWKLTLKIGRMS